MTNGSLGTVNLTAVENGAYTLELLVYGSGGIATTNLNIALDSNLKLGEFSFSQQDVTMPVSGIPLTVTRTYNSLDLRSADFGYGWTYSLNSLDVSLDEQRQDWQVGSDTLPLDGDDDGYGGSSPVVSVRTGGGHDVTLTLPDGRRTTFQFSMVPNDFSGLAYQAVWTPPSDVHATLTMNGDNGTYYLWGIGWQWDLGGDGSTFDNFDVPGWTLTMQDGTQYIITRGSGDPMYFDPDGTGNYTYINAYEPPVLTQIVQRSRNNINIGPDGISEYDGGTTLTRSIAFQRDGQSRIHCDL